MKSAKENRKITYTKMVLHESFDKLVAQYGVKGVTVKSLCEEADINRSTFYSHYEDLYSFEKEIEIEAAKKLMDVMNAYPYDENFEEKVLQSFLSLVEESGRKGFFLLEQGWTGEGLKYLRNESKKKFIPLWKERSSFSEEELNKAFDYLFGGTIEFFKRWYRDEKKIPFSEVSNIYMSLIRSTLACIRTIN